MRKRGSFRFAASAAAVLLAVPALAIVESYDDRAQAEFRSELPGLADMPVRPPAAIVNPHDEVPRARDTRQDDPSMRFELRDRRDDPLEPLWFERDGRPNSDGSPRLKDLINPDRRR